MQKQISRVSPWIGAVALVLVYAFIQQLDNDAELKESVRKQEIIAAAKAEFKRRQKWDSLLQGGEHLTFPVAAYQASQ
ncbi:hypothetical protein [Collimonas humicola]|uniref:hypothetical protein n=1 Tax=Collimonas humicola TaxID=2825886 RepID=UPI001B8AB55E|nr:hypothetical protein [Collimonas humicola]